MAISRYFSSSWLHQKLMNNAKVWFRSLLSSTFIVACFVYVLRVSNDALPDQNVAGSCKNSQIILKNANSCVSVPGRVNASFMRIFLHKKLMIKTQKWLITFFPPVISSSFILLRCGKTKKISEIKAYFKFLKCTLMLKNCYNLLSKL